MHIPPDTSSIPDGLGLIAGLPIHAEPMRRVPASMINKALANKLLPALLGGIAGSTDAIGFLALGGLFTAHITGNFVVLAGHLVSHGHTSIAVILSVPVFVAVLVATRWLAARLDALGIGLLQPLLLVECLLLSGFLAIRVLIGAPIDPHASNAILAGMLGVAAMAVQNAVGQICLGGLPTTAMTATVARLALDIGEIFATRNHHDRNWWWSRMLQAGPLAGFVIGCGLGAACEAVFDRWSLAFPVALSAFALALSFAPNPRPRNAL